MDELIQAIANALKKGWNVDKIHSTCLVKGWSEDDIFLAIKAGELLFNAIKEAEANKKPPVFRRVT